MFHVKPDEEIGQSEVAAAVAAVFGDGAPVARQYREILADAGVERGLIGPREVDRLWVRHILNCAVMGESIAEGSTIVDIGSGAGLPGIPLALARPDLSITLVEPLLRRHTFLTEVVEQLSLPIRVIRGRAEEKAVRAEIGLSDVVTSRAVAPLDRLARWSLPLIRPDGELIAIKGSSAADEISTHKAEVGKLGLTDLRVESCGTDTLAVPTTIIRGRLRSPSSRRR
ncbi:16S rRNA (guanine(527)-N(7))-methyltransferase RsmG [Williamsia maris]|uniref:Ribosomal RNA small subunit methyltransferase G n=1 Tax=Williamsia maris TaxID=72806 RepID=A0ABT1HCX5_9NOCA|nr:16S rRNA (guanine(527)-N(7))-methyltransferase RsmG [Williamsia maris]MCP2176110.1 16S rRNA (guanine527-N7)-methyltransferase [Williamsia maris]